MFGYLFLLYRIEACTYLRSGGIKYLKISRNLMTTLKI